MGFPGIVGAVAIAGRLAVFGVGGMMGCRC